MSSDVHRPPSSEWILVAGATQARLFERATGGALVRLQAVGDPCPRNASDQHILAGTAGIDPYIP